MAKTEYSEEIEITKAVNSVIKEKAYGLSALTNHGVNVLACFSIRTDKDGETQACKTNPISLKKVPDALRIFIRDGAHYILVVDYHSWQQWDEKTRSAKIWHELYSIEPEDTETGLKLKKRKPDISAYIPEAKLFGAYTPEMTDFFADLTKSAEKVTSVLSSLEEVEEKPEVGDPPRVVTASEEEEELKPSVPKKIRKKSEKFA